MPAVRRVRWLTRGAVGPEAKGVVDQPLEELILEQVRDEGVVVNPLETVSPVVIANWANPGSALPRLSRFFSSIAVTEFSFASDGASFDSLSCTKPDSCLATVDVLDSSRTIACRRATSMDSRSSR